MKIPGRFSTIKPWLNLRPSSAEWSVPFSDIMAFLLQPSIEQRGSRYIKAFKETPEYNILSLKVPSPEIYCDKTISFRSLCMILSEQLLSTDWHYYNAPETPVEEGDYVLDCGACEGLFTALSLKAAHIYCIEPSRLFTRLLKMTFEDCLNVTIVSNALGEISGEASFSDHGISSSISNSNEGYRVAVESIDDLCDRLAIRPTYLKADLEGFEMNMLKGAKHTISTCRPKVAITTYHDINHAGQIRDLLLSLNPNYKFRMKGLVASGAPVMLHAFE